MHDAVQDGGAGLLAEGRVAAGRVRDDRAQREHVDGAGQVASCGGLFGGHVGGSADHHPAAGQLALLGGPGHAEVDDRRALDRQHHVGRLQVPVDHAQLVHRDQPPGGLAQQQPHRLGGQRALVEPDGVAQGEPRYVGGGEPRGPGVAVTGEQRGGGLRGQPGEVVQLVPEAADEVLVLPRDRGQHLFDGDIPPLVDAEEDAPHPAGAQPSRERNPADLRRVVRSKRLGPAAGQVEHAHFFSPVAQPLDSRRSLVSGVREGKRLLENRSRNSRERARLARHREDDSLKPGRPRARRARGMSKRSSGGGGRGRTLGV